MNLYAERLDREDSVDGSESTTTCTVIPDPAPNSAGELGGMVGAVR